MDKLVVVLFLVIGVMACSEEPASPLPAREAVPSAPAAASKPAAVQPQPAASSTAEPAPPSPAAAEQEPDTDRPQLDLSAPTTLDFLGEVAADQETYVDRFDAAPLFDAGDSDNFSISLAPTFGEPENEDDPLPPIDGGSVSIEIQTP